ncbi:MAG: hypothetical protein IJE02_02480 [Clostridia bacterium]|nr:hypothetical protein [Clostridia bacterium]
MKFFIDIIVSTLSNIISVGIIAAIGYIALAFRYSIKRNERKKFIHPTKRVIKTNLNQIKKINKIESSFVNVFTKEEYDTIIELYRTRNGGRLYNSPAIRIEQVDNDTLTISQANFYDFIATNLSVFPANAPHKIRKNFIYTITKYFKFFEKNKDFEYSVKLKLGDKPDCKKVLNVSELANIATVSVIIEDINGKIGIVQRTNKVAISSGAFSATVAGTPTDIDYNENDPFFACVKREIAEELGLKNIEIEFQELIISKQKMQPVFLYLGKLRCSWENCYSTILDTKDYYFEVQNLFIVPQKDIICFVKQTNMTDAAAYQLWKYAFDCSGKDRWYNPIYFFKSLRKHCKLGETHNCK